MPYFDRFDVAMAWYVFLVTHHDGQFSDRYIRLCELTGPDFRFSPGAAFSESAFIAGEYPEWENALSIYESICEREGEPTYV